MKKEPMVSELAMRIARAFMPQMSVDAQNGNKVAQDGLLWLARRVQMELDK